jgi:hypothetical protein
VLTVLETIWRHVRHALTVAAVGVGLPRVGDAPERAGNPAGEEPTNRRKCQFSFRMKHDHGLRCRSSGETLCAWLSHPRWCYAFSSGEAATRILKQDRDRAAFAGGVSSGEHHGFGLPAERAAIKPALAVTDG